MRTRRANRYYTLLEMILAIAIFMMIMLTLSMGIASIYQTWKKMSKHSENLKIYQKIDRIVNSAFSNAIPFVWKDENRKKIGIFSGKEDTLTLAYQHRIGKISHGGIRFIKFFLDDGFLKVSYRPSPILYWLEDDSEITTEIISDQLESISFLYADREKDGILWYDSWDSDNPNIPLAIQITLKWNDGREEQWMRRTAGNSLYETFGKRKKYIQN